MGEKLRTLQVRLARTHVKQYLRKGESGKIENVQDYLRVGLPGASPVVRGKTAGGKTYVPKKKFSTGDEVTIHTPGSGLHKSAIVRKPLPNGKVEVRMAESGETRVVDARNLRHDEPGGNLPTAKAPKRRTPEDVAARRKAGTGKVKGYAGPKRSAAETKAILRKQGEKQSGFLGHDANGSEIKEGSPVSVTGGPDKGARGTVVGTAKGGGIRVKIGTGVQSREVLVDPDELRVKRGKVAQLDEKSFGGHEELRR